MATLLQDAAKLASDMQTGLFYGRTQIVYSYGRYGWTRGSGSVWHGGLDLVGMDDTTIRMPYYCGSGVKKSITGTVVTARIVTDHSNKTWEWGWYVCVKLDTNQTPDRVNYIYFCHCSKLLVDVGQRVKSGDTLAVMGQTGNAAGGYDHCHLEARETSTGSGLDPTAYSGTSNAVGVYGAVAAPDEPEQEVDPDEYKTIQLVTLAPLSDDDVRQTDALAETLGLDDSDRYSVVRVTEDAFAVTGCMTTGDAMKFLTLAQQNGWDKLKKYQARFVG